jgi:mannosyltransferase
VVTLAVMVYGLNGASYWRDETATVSATDRSFPQLVRMLGRVDAVHGLYYSVAWAVARVFGTSEIALRLPSAVAMAAAALGVAVIGRRLRSRRTGLLAGLVFAALPEVSLAGQDARSYAMVVAAATLASYLLLNVMERPGVREVAAYALAIAVLGYLNVVGLLLVLAHAVTVGRFALLESRAAGRWAAGAGAGIIATAPVVLFGWRQRSQIGWIPAPGWSSVWELLPVLTAGSVVSVAVISILATLGTVHDGQHARPAERLGWLCLPWIVVPPAVAFIAAQGQVHFYSPDYLLYLLPSVALLTGAGLASLTEPAPWAALALIIILALPAQYADRQPDGHGDDIRSAALFLAWYARGTDAVIYGGGPGGAAEPDWAFAYPYGFTKPRNIAWRSSPAAEAGLFGGTVPASVLLLRLARFSRVWVVELGRDMPDAPAIPAKQFRLTGTWQISDIWLRLYQR